MEPKLKKAIEAVLMTVIFCCMSIAAANVDLPDGTVHNILVWGSAGVILTILLVLFEEGVKVYEAE